MRPLTQDELNQVRQRYQLTPQARAQMIGFEKEDAPIEPQILPLSLNPMKAAATIAADTVGRGVGPRDDYKNDLAQAQSADDVRSVANNAVSKLENSHPIFGDRDKILAQKNELFRNINAQLAQNNQGELVTHKKSGQVFLRQGEDLTPLDDGMIKQIGRGIRDNVWSLVGAAASVKSGAGFKNNLVRGMIGTSVGGYADYVANSDYVGRELDAKEALAKMGEDALLSAAGDTIIGGAIRGYQGTKGLINEAKDKAAQATQKLKMSGENVKEKVADMTHPLKDVTAKTDIPIYDHVRTGNIRGAEANVADFGADLSIDEQRALRELMEIYTPQSTNANVKLSELAQGAKHIKENSATPEILRGVASKAEDAAQNLASKFADEDTAARQRLVFAKARADEKHINEFNGLIKESPEFAKKYADILDDDTRRFIDEIGASGERTGDEVGDILGEYVKKIKDDYAKTTSEIKNAINTNGVKLDEGLIRSAAEDVKTYIKSQTDLSPVTNRILKVLDDGADAEALFEARHAVNSLIRQADYKPTKDKLIRLKQSLDDGIFASTGKSGMELERLKNSLYDADVKYSQMKRIEDDSLYEGIQKGTTKELTQAKLDKKFRNTNDKLNEYLSGLDAPSRERLEIEAIKNTLERNIKETMGGKRVVDYSGMLKTLKDNPNYKSEAAKKAIEITEKMNKIHGLDHTLADAFKAPKDPKLQQGLSHNVAVRYLTMAANRAVQNTVKFLPFLQMGKTAASRHAIYNAVMSSSSARELGEKLSKAAMNKDIPVSEKIDIIEMAKAQFKFSNELDKAKADGIVKEATTKQENNVIKKGEAPGQHPGANFANESAPMAKDSQGLAFSPYKDDAQRVAQTNNDIILQNSAKGEAAEQGSKLEQAEAKQEVVKGEGWTMRDGGSAKQYARHKFEVEKWINDLSGVLSDEWAANLKTLALKHPEMFKSEADVFRVIKEIKDNPTHFFKNNIDENALMVKHLDDKKVGEIGVRKSDGQIVHVTKNNKDKRIKELERRQDKLLGNTELEKATGRRASTDTPVESRTMATANKAGSVANEKGQWQGRPPSLHTDTKPAGANGANARSLTADSIIPQNSAKDETAIKTHVNPHVGTGLAGGTLNAKDENGNFDAEKFAKGFIYGLFGSKVTAATLKKTNPKLYDQIVKIAEGNASKEKISSFVNKLKQDELGKLLQKTITNKDLSTKTKIEIIEAAKKRFAKETPKSLNGQSEAQMSESALKAKENNLKIDDVSNDAKEKWIKTFGLKSIDDDFIPNLKPEVKKAIKDKEIRLTKGSLLKIVARGREKYIPLIKQSLEDTDMVLKDEGTFLFVKEMDDKSLVFTSVGRNFDTHITIISNAPKKINNIKNKLMNKAEVVYRSSKLRTTPL